jgi:carnosine N-methyltransferase
MASSKMKICVPGAGVGRLACELAAMGYTVQGNEFSLYMLLASDFILNGPVVSVSSITQADIEMKQPEEAPSPIRPHPLSISPWLLETRNVHNMVDPFRTVQIPDVDPFDMVVASQLSRAKSLTNVSRQQDDHILGSGSDFSMTAGDFSSIYSVDSEANAWDGVVTCFFLDASPNVIEYLQTIYHMLKPNGILINFGPLHWHWSGPAMLLTDESMSDYYDRYDHLDSKYLQSYDYCWEDIQTILQNIGFSIIEKADGIPAHYTADPLSMIQTEYRCIHFVAQKKTNDHSPITIET